MVFDGNQGVGGDSHERNNLTKLSITEGVMSSSYKAEVPPGLAQSPTTSDRDSNDTESTMTATQKRPILWTLARFLFLDIPLVFVFLVFMSLCWIHHVHDHYLVKQLEASTWNFERDTTDETYYYRYCDENDLTTTNPLDLYLPHNATPDDAYQHQLRHGFTMFPGVLSQETCTNLRNYIVNKNRNLSEEESIWLIEWDHRYSFHLGTEEPSVSKAVMELASNQRLKQSMAKILGDENPALIELTAISSSYGAKAQEYHHDGRTNMAQFGRSVAHSYSIFIMLQNTTSAGGATGACPGTHYCAESLYGVCEEHGVQPLNQEGYWPAGDALVMNMDSWHRGSSHTDPNSPDRVMLILTFSSRPRQRAESRFLPQGISYSLRWDMWGHTWSDLETADRTLKQPWTGLRALGLYCKSADYGVDYVTSATQRMPNEWFGFTKEDLHNFIHLGGFKFLPSWLQYDVDEETTWHQFLHETFLLCKNFVKSLCLYSTAVYMLLCSVAGIYFAGGIKGGTRRFGSAVIRLAIMVNVVLVLYKVAIQQVDNSSWASDLRNSLLYTSPFGNEVSEYDGPLTMPHRNDILIDTRYKSPYLGMYNDFIGNVPGNRLWNDLVEETTTLFKSYSHLPAVFTEAISEFIVGAVQDNAGRFLYQNFQSHWAELSFDDSVEITTRELVIRSNSILNKMIKEVDFLISEAKYGALRKAAMVKNDIFEYLLDLKDRFVESVSRKKKEATLCTIRPDAAFTSQSSRFVPPPTLPSVRRSAKKESSSRQVVLLPVGQVPGEPEPNAWLREGDIVNAKRKEGGQWGMFKATLKHVLSSGICFVEFHIDETMDQVLCKLEMTRFKPPKVEDRVDIKMADGQFLLGMIVRNKGDGIYNVRVSDGRLFENMSDGSFRRPLNKRRG